MARWEFAELSHGTDEWHVIYGSARHYYRETTGNDNRALNALGKHGWDVVHLERTGGFTRYLLRRDLDSTEARDFPGVPPPDAFRKG